MLLKEYFISTLFKFCFFVYSITATLLAQQTTAFTNKIQISEPSIDAYQYSPDLMFNTISTGKKPQTQENTILPNYYTHEKTPEAYGYDSLEFQDYLKALFENNENIDAIFYQKKIDYISTILDQNRYNFDIFFNGYVRTGSYISTQQLNIPAVQTAGFSESGYGVSINANKLLYDGQYSLLNNNYKILKQRVASIKALNSKTKLALFASNIYSSMYVSQEKLKIYTKIYALQTKVANIIQESYKKGVYSTIDYIDSKNDLLVLKRSLIALRYEHLHNEYIVKYSIKSKSQKRYKLLTQDINFELRPLPELQKQALQNNSDLAIESNKLKISQTDLLAQKRKYYPSISFTSYLGYGALNNELYFNQLEKYTTSPFFEMALRVNIPLYNRGDIIASKASALNSLLLQRNVLSLKTKEILLNVENSAHTLERLRAQTSILQEQVTLINQKVNLTQEGYTSGTLQYRDYADAIKSYIEYKVQLLELQQNYIQEMFLLSTLIGKKELYE